MKTKKMTKKTDLRDGYIIQPKNQEIIVLRKLFGKIKKLEKTKAEKMYEQKRIKNDLVNRLNNGTLKDLLNLHFSYDYKTWVKSMDKLADFLRLEKCKTLYETGFGSGTILRYFSEKYPKLSVSGNDFFEIFVQSAKGSKYIGNGAFVYANSRYLDFIPDNTFDALLSWGSIGYEDKEGSRRGMQEMIRICKSGGRILIGNMDNSEKPTPYPSAYQTPFSVQELKSMAKKEKVKIIKLGTDKDVINIEGHAADVRLTICMEKSK